MPSACRSFHFDTTSSGRVLFNTEPADSKPIFCRVPEWHTPPESVYFNAHLARTPEVFRCPQLSEGIEQRSGVQRRRSVRYCVYCNNELFSQLTRNTMH